MSAEVMVMRRFRGNRASRITMAVMSLVMDAMGTTRSVFLASSGRWVRWSTANAVPERRNGGRIRG